MPPQSLAIFLTVGGIFRVLNPRRTVSTKAVVKIHIEAMSLAPRTGIVIRGYLVVSIGGLGETW